jgi:ubiquitin C-terminal hydrolase
MNSVLQCLLGIIALVKYFLKYDTDNVSHETCPKKLIHSFSLLVKQYFSPESSVDTPMFVVRWLGTVKYLPFFG